MARSKQKKQPAGKSRTPKQAADAVRRDGTINPTGPLIRSFVKVSPKGPRPRRILWIPGLGEDRVMFAPIISRLDHLVHPAPLHSFLEFPDVTSGEVDSLESLAGLLAQGILPDEPYDMVVGYSLGGMMLQILRMKGLLEARTSVLLSSGFSGNDLTSLIALGCRMPAPPMFLRGPAQALVSAMYPLFRMGLPTARDLGRAFGRFPRTIFFEAPGWIRDWKGVPEPFYNDCLVIHGTNDLLLSYDRIHAIKPPDLTIPGGSHIIFATHNKELADFLATRLNHKPLRTTHEREKPALRASSKRKVAGVSRR